LLKHIEETEKYVEITGFRNVEIEDVEEFVKSAFKKTAQNTWIQFFDAELVATWKHLYFAVLNTLLSFNNARNISKRAPIEIMLYASAQRQIRKAIQLIGVKIDSANIAVVIVGKSPDIIKARLVAISKLIGNESDETVLEILDEKVQVIRKAFEITETEFETVMEDNNVKQALVYLVIERMALLSTQL
jgi:KEOPS complex subunit Cgi121